MNRTVLIKVNQIRDSCNKIINSHQSVGDSSGCPFRHSSAANLTTLIRAGPPIGPSTLPEILALTKDGNYTLACTRYLDTVKDQMGTKLEFEQINHPNQYFEMAQGERRNRERNHEKKEGEEANEDDMDIDR
jgi:DNA primase large subunit